jgi:ubiquinone biosynthesis protein
MMIETLSAARDLGRLNDIAGILIRHGFGDTVRRFGLTDLLARAGHMLHDEHAADLARLSPPENLRRALEELGPAFVKFGQLMAGRADLLSGEWIAELEKLHSQVPALPLEALREQLRADLGGEPEDVFAHFEPQALAGASIAQVHRAQLKDGREVIVKIRRPGIEDTIEADLRLLERLAHVAENQVPALKPYGPVRLVHELARSLRRELNLAAECRHAERIAKNLAPLAFVSIPQVHWAHTGPRMNVQDLVQGIPGEALGRLREEGLDPPLLARRGAQAVLKMIVEDGFFHADPHPGNVFYLPGNRLAFIDFGMVGRLSQRRREELLQLLLGLVQHEPQDVADVLLDWTASQSGPGAHVDLTQLENEIEAFVDQYHGTPLAQLQLGTMLTEVTAILREHHLALPADLALLIKAFISLESMGRGLDPDFHMASEALPLLRQVVRARYQPQTLAKRGWHSLRSVFSLVERLPHDLMQLVRRARRGKLQLHLDLIHLKRVGDQIDRAASRLSMALVIAGLVIGSSIVMTVSGGPTLFGLPAFGLLGFIAAVLGGFWLVHSIRAGGRHGDDEAE